MIDPPETAAERAACIAACVDWKLGETWLCVDGARSRIKSARVDLAGVVDLYEIALAERAWYDEDF